MTVSLKRQFKLLVPTTGMSVAFRDMPTPDLAKHMNAKALCDRADLIQEFKFRSHEDCYWQCGEYRIRCDQAGGKDGCIGPKFYVKLKDTVNDLPAQVYASCWPLTMVRWSFHFICTAFVTTTPPLSKKSWPQAPVNVLVVLDLKKLLSLHG